MKKLLFILFTLISFTALAQNPVIVNRASQANTVQDARLAAKYNFLLPRYNDSLEANANIGLDSIGAMWMERSTGIIYKRISNPKMWVESGGLSSLQQAFDKSVLAGDNPTINGHGENGLSADSLNSLLLSTGSNDDDNTTIRFSKGVEGGVSIKHNVGVHNSRVGITAGAVTMQASDQINVTSPQFFFYGLDTSYVNIVNAPILGTPPPYIAAFDGDTLKKVAYPSGGGTVTSVTASSPLASSGGATPNIIADTTSGNPTSLVTQYQRKKTADSLQANIAAKQDLLVSGTNIKTINGSSVLGSGNLVVSGGGSLTDSLIITPNMFVGLGLNDVQKIQRALDTSVSQHKQLLIPFNKERGSKYWMIDSAILLHSNSYVVIQNAVLKLTDSSRDNIFRTYNIGIGLTNPSATPLQNITIQGVGEATLEGADNPRSTGDASKSLGLYASPLPGTSYSYGTDSGKVGRSQFGDWRNYGVIIAYTDNVFFAGIKLSYMHAYGVSFERCKNVKVFNIIANMPGYAAVGGKSRIIKNSGAIDFNQSIRNVFIDNVSGISADDNVALNIINTLTGGGGVAGSIRSFHASGDTSNSSIDSIYNVTVSNVNSRVLDNSVRILVPPNGCKASYINITNITNDTNPSDSLYVPYGSGINSSIVLVGSTNPVYGGNNPFGQISKVTINNLKSSYTKYGVRVQTTLSESAISEIYKGSATYASTPAVYGDTPSVRFRNIVEVSPNVSIPFGNSVIFSNTNGTNRDLKMSSYNVADNISGITFYPNSGTNVLSDFSLIPKGTGFSTTAKTQFKLYNTDFIADATNYEFSSLRATGSTGYGLFSAAAGTGVARPLWVDATGGQSQATSNVFFGIGGQTSFGSTTVTDKVNINGNLNLLTAGNKLKITEGTNGSVGQTTLVAGTKAITISGLTTSSRAIITYVSVGGTVTTTWQYAGVCTSNTLTITALTNAGTTNTSDTSVLNYFIIN